MKIRRIPKVQNQQGIASIIIVSVLVILLSLVSIGFSRLVNRDASSALQDQKARIASYAAESGINQVISYINQNSKLTSKNLSNCQNSLLDKLNSNSGLSGDKTTEYTCILLNLTPSDLKYTLSQPLQSKTIKLTAPKPFTSLFLSWASTSDAVPVPGGSQNLLDEQTWNRSGYMPMMRVTVYAVPPNNELSGADYMSRTFFLYPGKGTGSNIIELTGPQAAADGSLLAVNCQAQIFNNFSYVSPGQQYCSVIFDNPPANDSTIYLRITPLYGPARVFVKAQTASGDVTFRDSQAVVDATAKSNDVVKRLQARVELNGEQGPPEADNIPEFALRSAGTLCKRFVVIGLSVTIDPASINDCGNNQIIANGCPLPVATTHAATYVTQFSAVLEGTVRPNCYKATYYFEYASGPDHIPNENLTAVPAKPGDPITIDKGISFDYPEFKALLLDLRNGKEYHFRICGVNKTGTSCGQFLPIAFNGPQPKQTLAVVTDAVDLSILNPTGGPPGCGSGQQTYVFEGDIWPFNNKQVNFWWEEYYQNPLLKQPPSATKKYPVPPPPLTLNGRPPNVPYHVFCPIPTSVFKVSFGYFYRFCAKGDLDGTVCGQWLPPPDYYKGGL